MTTTSEVIHVIHQTLFAKTQLTSLAFSATSSPPSQETT